MTTTYEDGDRISLTRLDVRLLTALLAGPFNGNQWRLQAEKDWDSNTISQGSLMHSIKGLLAYSFIEKVESPSSRSGYVYRITHLGREFLTYEVDRWRRLVELEALRSKRQH